MGPCPHLYIFLNSDFSPESSPIHGVGFICCVNRINRQCEDSLQYQKIILLNNTVDHIFKKNPGECTPCASAFPHFYCPPGKGWRYGHMFPLDLISSFLLKIHPKQHFTAILEHVLWIFLCFVCTWFWGLTPNILLNWCVYLRVGVWVYTYVHHTHIHAPYTHTCTTHTHRTSRTHSAVFVWKATLKNNDFFSFWHLQIKRDMSYLCSSVAAKSLSPRGTKQGFVVGFARAAQCLCVKHPKL